MAKTARSKYYVDTLSDLSDDVLLCHAYGHSWDPSPVSKLSPVGREVWVVKLTCVRCTKVRTDYVEPGTYTLDDRHYTKVFGYTPAEPAKRVDYREEAIRRQWRKQKSRNLRAAVPELHLRLA